MHQDREGLTCSDEEVNVAQILVCVLRFVLLVTVCTRVLNQ